MERRGDKGTSAAAARARRHADQPSFSSSLLDAIYRSMEDEPGHAGGEAVTAAATKKQQQQQQQEEALHYSYYYRPSLAGSYRARAPAPAAPGPHATTSSSSECSSYGGFSSSEAESSNHRRLRPIRTTVPGGQPAPAPEKKTKKPAGASIRAKLRDLRKPASPGARLAGFLNTIFAGKRAPQTPPSARTAVEYACSSASSYSRSCLSKTPSTRGHANRTVRFVDSDREAPATVPGADRRRVPAQAVEQMLLRRMEMESDEDDEESSDASSDLFELENFAAAAVPPGAGYRDELPVYETTRVVLNRGIGHACGHGRSARIV